MNETKDFDADLQMFRETPQPANEAHLRFLRWLVEHGRLESPVATILAGELAAPVAVR